MQKRLKVNEIMFIGMIYILFFQSPLETYVWDKFTYIDECFVVIGGLALIYHCSKGKLDRINKENYLLFFLLAVFGISGLLGNLLYQYQPWEIVFIDCIANYKFFFSILVGYFLFADVHWQELKRYANIHTKCITLMLSIIFVLDRIFNIFSGHIRYGIKSNTLFFEHPSYIAAALVFLIVLQVVFYDGKSWPYFAANIIMMFFTMRYKVIATAVVFVAIYIWLIILNKKLYIKHFVVLGCVALIIGAPMIYFYYIQSYTWSPRAVMTLTSLKIIRDYFPIGTGFGTYASYMANKNYSPVYIKYGFENIELLRADSYFLNDTFWPIVMGQTGFIGTVAYILMLVIMIRKCLKIKDNVGVYTGALFVIIYLAISSVAEPTFNNSISIPLAFVLGLIWRHCSVKRE